MMQKRISLLSEISNRVRSLLLERVKPSPINLIDGDNIYVFSAEKPKDKREIVNLVRRLKRIDKDIQINEKAYTVKIDFNSSALKNKKQELDKLKELLGVVKIAHGKQNKS